MTRRIYIAEDEQNLIDEARTHLENSSLDSLVQTEHISNPYEVIVIDLDQANGNIKYWAGLGITTNDLLVFDLHYKNKNFSGKELIKTVETGVQGGYLPGVKQALVSTSKKGHATPGPELDADLAFTDGFDLYGLEKATEGHRHLRETNVSLYGPSLRKKIDAIYAGTEKPINGF